LGTEIKSAKWESSGTSLSTRVITGDKSVLGSVVWGRSKGIDPCNLGVYNTPQLLALLSVVGNDIDFKLTKMGETYVSVDLIDKKYGTISKYMLSDLSVIPTPPPLKNLPNEWDLDLKINKQFISTFISGNGALSENDTFTVIAQNDEVNIVIGFSNVGTNRVTIPVEVKIFKEITPVSFNANIFSNILQANRECESVDMKVSDKGLIKLNFDVDDFESEYYVVATQNVV
jgi:hypothetical protein|tara:strand:+ start:315 stop:1004 length:690 start_codon:yes stop_codon:yes gene_type:complete